MDRWIEAHPRFAPVQHVHGPASADPAERSTEQAVASAEAEAEAAADEAAYRPEAPELAGEGTWR